MADAIQDIEGIGPAIAQKLVAAGIRTTEDLLTVCATRSGRGGLASETGLSEAQLLKWANHADLMRIKGVGGEFAELLEAAGVDTVKELRGRNAENLAVKMREVNDVRSLTRMVPSATTLEKWIDEAKGMEPRIAH